MENDKDLLLVAILTFFTVFLWIFFEFTKTTRTSTIDPQITEILAPIDPTLKTEVLDILETRTVYH
ncbi:hypothetical protein A2154_04200 [Candidatus Gottesmanbacteria bacterium RBG_16_43_7]|uniref:Uncharacterized protein n=1 Tax=Candidatus Gottesmanbacteria bacterium RBG_16_43_7 TaxID=1798373 RepID=A0A1F5Z9K9_9BACT|nr:MAG: hypothetical protein A2154_04200 [Candidatus Gottesmanbacteria bacterium RBG_16_43_7]